LLASDIETVLASLPQDLNAMYDRILQEDIPENHRHLALKVLRWLAVSYRPLEVEEVSEVCTIPSEPELGEATMLGQDRLDLKQLSNLLPNLIMLDSSSGAKTASLVFAHFSVREYLTGSQLLEFPSAYFRIQMKDANRSVAKECLAYLYFSRTMGLSGALTDYAFGNWHLHAATTGELDKETQRDALLLRIEILWGDDNGAVTLEKAISKEFISVTQWLGSPERIHKLISILREIRSLPRELQDCKLARHGAIRGIPSGTARSHY
jgi:hypothetical protein